MHKPSSSEPWLPRRSPHKLIHTTRNRDIVRSIQFTQCDVNRLCKLRWQQKKNKKKKWLHCFWFVAWFIKVLQTYQARLDTYCLKIHSFVSFNCGLLPNAQGSCLPIERISSIVKCSRIILNFVCMRVWLFLLCFHYFKILALTQLHFFNYFIASLSRLSIFPLPFLDVEYFGYLNLYNSCNELFFKFLIKALLLTPI